MIASTSNKQTDKTIPAERASRAEEKFSSLPCSKHSSPTLQMSNRISVDPVPEALADSHLMLVERVTEGIQQNQSLSKDPDLDMSDSGDEDDEMSETEEMDNLMTLDKLQHEYQRKL